MAIPTRSGSKSPNPDLLEVKHFKGDNLAFIRRALRELPYPKDLRRRIYVVLLGSCDLMGVTLRQAQGIVRRDLRPGLWSHAFAFVIPQSPRVPKDLGAVRIRGVPLDTRSPRLPEPAWNGITETDLSHYNDPMRDANIAVLSIDVTSEEAEAVINRFYRPNDDRVRYDLWSSLCTWAQYYWSFGAAENPFRSGVPMPASAFIEYCFDAIQLDLTPAVSERLSAPEVLWISAKYWHGAYRERGHAFHGLYTIRDERCCVLPPDSRDRPTQAIR